MKMSDTTFLLATLLAAGVEAAVAADPVVIFENPPDGEFASFTSTPDGQGLRLRYDSKSQSYQFRLTGERGWLSIQHDTSYEPLHGRPRQQFTLGSLQSRFLIYASYRFGNGRSGYQYSNLSFWNLGARSADSPYNGFTSFGMATEAAALPTSGAALYRGMILGASDLTTIYEGAPYFEPVLGMIRLQVDFAAGTLSGRLLPELPYREDIPLGPMLFTGQLHDGGAGGLSAVFNNDPGGRANIVGTFTGPSGEEMIGKWNFRFTGAPDGQVHRASGAWIAKGG